jgi:hypothetical protein
MSPPTINELRTTLSGDGRLSFVLPEDVITALALRKGQCMRVDIAGTASTLTPTEPPVPGRRHAWGTVRVAFSHRDRVAHVAVTLPGRSRRRVGPSVPSRPVAWEIEGGALHVTLPAEIVAAAEGEEEPPAADRGALAVDRPEAWRGVDYGPHNLRLK